MNAVTENVLNTRTGEAMNANSAPEPANQTLPIELEKTAAAASEYMTSQKEVIIPTPTPTPNSIETNTVLTSE